MRSEELVLELQGICSEKLNIMQQMLTLTKAQNTSLLAIEDEKIDCLNQIIEEKQSLIEIVNQLDHDFLRNLDVLKKLLNIDSLEECTQEPVEGFKELKGIIEEIMNISEEMRQLDKENMQRATSNMDELKKQLKSIKVGQKATNSYNRKYMETPSILIDKKR